MPSQEAEELVLLATLVALALAKDRSVFELGLIGAFLTVVADQILLLAVVQEEEELQRDQREEAKKEKEAAKKDKETDKRLAELEKAVIKLKEANDQK